MADVVVTILTPTLTGSDYFKTRYRLLPGGAYTANVNRTNAPFTLTGLATGDYEMEIIFVRVIGAEEVDCPITIHEFSVEPEFACFGFTGEIVQNGALYELVLDYTLPSPLSWPPCGFLIRYNQGGGTTNITYATLPLSGQLIISLPANLDTNVTVLADMCGYYQVCFEEEVPKIAEPACTDAVVTGYDLVYSTFWNIRAFVTNSNPSTNPYIFSFQELSLVNANTTPDSGFKTEVGLWNASQNLFFGATTVQPKGIELSIPGSPDELLPNCIIYKVSFVDYCGTNHTFEVRGLWTPPPFGSIPGTPGTFTPNGC